MRVVSFFMGIIATIITIVVGASVGGWYLIRPSDNPMKNHFFHYKDNEFYCVNVDKL